MRHETQRAVHTCGGPYFGKLAPAGDCARCDELRAGAPARAWAGGRDRRRRLEAAALEDLRRHNCARAGCGSVCTFGDW